MSKIQVLHHHRVLGGSRGDEQKWKLSIDENLNSLGHASVM